MSGGFVVRTDGGQPDDTASWPELQAGRRIPELDGLRGIAVLAVVAVHVAPDWAQRSLGLSFGWAGVDLFFVLSGFLITGILRRLRSDPRYYARFYGRRARRIFPLAALVIVACAIDAMVAGRFSRSLFAMYATFTTSLVPSGWWLAQLGSLPRATAVSLGPMWTLSVEETFYLIWAPLVRRCSQAALAAICLTVIVCVPPARLWVHAPGSPEAYFFLTRMDALAWGALASLALEADATRWARRSSLGAALALAALVAIFFMTDRGDVGRRLFAAAGYTILDAACAAVLIAALTQPRRWRWLSQRALVHIGIVSYGIYLVHGSITVLLSAILGGDQGDRTIVRAALTLALSVLVASASWRYFEWPILNRGTPRRSAS